MCEICSKLTIQTQKPRQSSITSFNTEQISHIVMVFIVDFEQVKAVWVNHLIYNSEKVLITQSAYALLIQQ